MIDPYKKTVNVTISIKVNGVEKDITLPVPVTEDNIFKIESIYMKWEDIENESQTQNSMTFSQEINDVSYFEWTTRTQNVLKTAGIKKLSDLVFTCENELRGLPNCGKKSLREVKETLAEIGLELGISPELYETWCRMRITND